jgi:hypothetical protein
MLGDKFIYLTKVQFEKTSWQNRNRLRTATGWTYFTVPVFSNGRHKQNICDVEIDNKTHWKEKHRKTIELNYFKTPYYKEYKDFIKDLYSRNWTFLCELDIYITNFIINELDIPTQILNDCDYSFSGSKTELLVDMCKKTNCDTYYSNKGSQVYVDIDCFINNSLKHYFIDYIGIEYPQLYPGFENYLSILDLLMNCGRIVTKNILSDKNNYAFSELNKTL